MTLRNVVLPRRTSARKAAAKAGKAKASGVKAKSSKAKAPAAKQPKAKADPVALSTGSSAPQASERQSIEEAIGAQVRALRKRQDMTVSDLASQANLSAGMLSKVENGAISPSLATLQSLSMALNVPVTTFFAAFEERRDISHVRAGEGLVIERRGSKVGHQYQLLGHSRGGDIAFEPYLITLTKDAESYANFRHEGQEFIYILQGEVGYRHGDRIYRLKPGDSLFFDARAAHGPEELRKLPLRFLSIIVFAGS